MTTRRVITLLAGVAAWACNGDTTQPRPPSDLVVSGGARDDNYELQNVVLQTIGTVTWTRTGVHHHNVTFGSGPAIPAKIFEADLEPGTVASRTRTFTALGTYSYSCTNHPPNMKGTVTVVH